jgi:hypothetical protein
MSNQSYRTLPAMTNDCNRFVTDAPPALIPVGMRVETHVLAALDATDRKRVDSALLHACIAIDATAGKLYPGEAVGERYRKCLREYYWLLEPMIGAGMNLADTRFPNVGTPGNANPEFADIVYRIFRCHDAHGDEIPLEYALTKSEGGAYHWLFADGKLHMPDLVVFALLGVAVFSRANADVCSAGEYYLSLGKEVFPIKDWWGREDDFRPSAEKYNQVKVKVQGLENIVPEGPDGPKIARAIVKQPYVAP